MAYGFRVCIIDSIHLHGLELSYAMPMNCGAVVLQIVLNGNLCERDQLGLSPGWVWTIIPTSSPQHASVMIFIVSNSFQPYQLKRLTYPRPRILFIEDFAVRVFDTVWRQCHFSEIEVVLREERQYSHLPFKEDRVVWVSKLTYLAKYSFGIILFVVCVNIVLSSHGPFEPAGSV